MLEHPDSSAYVPGRPAASRSQRTSPRGVRRPSAHSTARRTVGHMTSAMPLVAGHQVLVPGADGDVRGVVAFGRRVGHPPGITDRGQEPSARWFSRSHR